MEQKSILIKFVYSRICELHPTFVFAKEWKVVNISWTLSFWSRFSLIWSFSCAIVWSMFWFKFIMCCRRSLLLRIRNLLDSTLKPFHQFYLFLHVRIDIFLNIAWLVCFHLILYNTNFRVKDMLCLRFI